MNKDEDSRTMDKKQELKLEHIVAIYERFDRLYDKTESININELKQQSKYTYQQDILKDIRNIQKKLQPYMLKKYNNHQLIEEETDYISLAETAADYINEEISQLIQE